MPLQYILLHLALAAACAFAVLRMPARPAWSISAAVAAFLLVGAGMLIERRADWTWQAATWGIQDLVFLTNLSLQGAAALVALLWRAAAPARRTRVRAGLVGALLLAAAIWSYAWYFAPLPADLRARPDAAGLCLQSTDDSCSACAAVMLLGRHGVVATEVEMARLCLTRAAQGTSALGLYRGLAIKARSAGLLPKLVHARDSADVAVLRGPTIIGVGLRSDTPQAQVARMQGYGWSFTARHAVLVERVEPDSQWLVVSDPTNGVERWPVSDLKYLWDGSGLTLAR